MTSTLAVFLALFVAFLAYKSTRRRSARLPLPPGPPADPLIGHARVMPVRNPEEKFYEWGKKYGKPTTD